MFHHKTLFLSIFFKNESKKKKPHFHFTSVTQELALWQQNEKMKMGRDGAGTPTHAQVEPSSLRQPYAIVEKRSPVFAELMKWLPRFPKSHIICRRLLGLHFASWVCIPAHLFPFSFAHFRCYQGWPKAVLCREISFAVL